MTSTRQVIESHWDAANARDWRAFEALLHPQLHYEVPQTREYIDGLAGYVDLFVTWPGDWRAQIRSLVCEDDRAVCVIDFIAGGSRATGISLFRIEDGRVREVTDWWPEPYEPPPRRTGYMKRRAAAPPSTKPPRREKVDPARVSLREVTADTVRPVVRLQVAESQKGLVAPNAVSLAQALFAPDAWYRAIYLDDRPVGFVMLEDQSLRQPPPAEPEIAVWRFMVDEHHQGLGIGEAALRQVIAHVRARGRFGKLLLSYVPAPGGPDAFYRRLGFRDTGRQEEGELVMELAL